MRTYVDNFAIRWDEIKKVGGIGTNCLAINDDICAISPREGDHIPQFIEAIDIYLQETRSKTPSDKPGYIQQ